MGHAGRLLGKQGGSIWTEIEAGIQLEYDLRELKTHIIRIGPILFR